MYKKEIDIICVIVKIKELNQEWIVLRKFEQDNDVMYTVNGKVYKEFFENKETGRRAKISQETRKRWNKQRNIKRNIEEIYEGMKGFRNEDNDFNEEIIDYKKEFEYEKVCGNEIEKYHVYVIEEFQKNLVLKEGYIKIKIEDLSKYCYDDSTLREYNKRIVKEESNILEDQEEIKKGLDEFMKENIKIIIEGIEIAKIENEKESLEGFKTSLRNVIEKRIIEGIGFIGECIKVGNFELVIKEKSIDMICVREIRRILWKDL